MPSMAETLDGGRPSFLPIFSKDMPSSMRSAPARMISSRVLRNGDGEEWKAEGGGGAHAVSQRGMGAQANTRRDERARARPPPPHASAPTKPQPHPLPTHHCTGALRGAVLAVFCAGLPAAAAAAEPEGALPELELPLAERDRFRLALAAIAGCTSVASARAAAVLAAQ